MICFEVESWLSPERFSTLRQLSCEPCYSVCFICWRAHHGKFYQMRFFSSPLSLSSSTTCWAFKAHFILLCTCKSCFILTVHHLSLSNHCGSSRHKYILYHLALIHKKSSDRISLHCVQYEQAFTARFSEHDELLDLMNNSGNSLDELCASFLAFFWWKWNN